MLRALATSLVAFVVCSFSVIVPSQAQYTGGGYEQPNNQAGSSNTDTGRVQTINACSIVLTWNMGPGRYSTVYQFRGDEVITVMGIPIPWNQVSPGWIVSIGYSYEGAWESYKVARQVTVQLAPLSGTIYQTNSGALEIECIEDGQYTRYQMKVTPKTNFINFGQYTLAKLPYKTPVVCWAIAGSNPIIAMSVQVQKPESAPPPATTQPAALIPAGHVGLPQDKKPGG